MGFKLDLEDRDRGAGKNNEGENFEPQKASRCSCFIQSDIRETTKTRKWRVRQNSRKQNWDKNGLWGREGKSEAIKKK